VTKVVGVRVPPPAPSLARRSHPSARPSNGQTPSAFRAPEAGIGDPVQPEIDAVRHCPGGRAAGRRDPGNLPQRAAGGIGNPAGIVKRHRRSAWGERNRFGLLAGPVGGSRADQRKPPAEVGNGQVPRDGSLGLVERTFAHRRAANSQGECQIRNSTRNTQPIFHRHMAVGRVLRRGRSRELLISSRH
jgi:hypothetical protein